MRDFFADAEAEAIVTARAISSDRTEPGFELWQGMRHLHSEGMIETRVSASPAPPSPSRFSLAATPNLAAWRFDTRPTRCAPTYSALNSSSAASPRK